MLEVYQGNTKQLNLAFTNDDGTPLNLSGYTLYYTVKQSYTDTNALISIVQTGHDIPASGTTHILLTAQDTNQCPGDYLAGFTLVSSGSGISTFDTDGLRIIPAPLVLV